ncbi:HesA/MoeB/ThiF family protein [Moraxella nasovis]|uniref:HesA/MoeB/ThiF family protein n=1 Tax=Moraxella nasovis TaxID=2904121 RepID=UPI001F62510A|nr:HesA/MoeB/ThiF family protein [Moraxella nasovis]UNU73394.1 HesA/MoeB/ThiF family protein [Moraxella nasovis]
MMTLTDDELLRYARQILLDDWDIDAQTCLKNSRILIIGLGGLGCFVAQTLVRAGVGSVHLVDYDMIDESNLQRQILFTKADIGQSKAKTAYEQLCTQNELITITYQDIKLTYDNIMAVLAACRADLVLDCTDNFMVRDLINRTCVALSTPLLSASAIGQVGQLLFFNDFSKQGCYHCIFGDDTDDNAQNCTNSGVLASTVAVMASLQAQVALSFLGKGKNPIANTLILWQGETLTQRRTTFAKNPTCTVCKSITNTY